MANKRILIDNTEISSQESLNLIKDELSTELEDAKEELKQDIENSGEFEVLHYDESIMLSSFTGLNGYGNYEHVKIRDNLANLFVDYLNRNLVSISNGKLSLRKLPILSASYEGQLYYFNTVDYGGGSSDGQSFYFTSNILNHFSGSGQYSGFNDNSTMNFVFFRIAVTGEIGSFVLSEAYRCAGPNKSYLNKTNTIAYTPTGDYHPATKKYVDDAVASVDLSSVKTQLAEMPEASAENLGNVYQFIGETTEDFISGYFYQCIGTVTTETDDSGNEVEVTTYSWKNISTSLSEQKDEFYYIDLTSGYGGYIRMFEPSNTDVTLSEDVIEKFRIYVNECFNGSNFTKPLAIRVNGSYTAFCCKYDIGYTGNTDSTFEFWFSVPMNDSTESSNEPRYRGFMKVSRFCVAFKGRTIGQYQTWSDAPSYYRTMNTKKNKDYLELDNTTAFTPTADYHPSTKKYVDDAISNLDIPESSFYVINLTSDDNVNLAYINSPYCQSGVQYLSAGCSAKFAEYINKHFVGNHKVSKPLMITYENTYNLFVDDFGNGTENSSGETWATFNFYCTNVVRESSNKISKPTGVLKTINFNIRLSLADENGQYNVLEDRQSYYSEQLHQGYLSTQNTTAYTPTKDYHPATKKYVDDTISSAGGSRPVFFFEDTANFITDSTSLSTEYNKEQFLAFIEAYNEGLNPDYILRSVRGGGISGSEPNYSYYPMTDVYIDDTYMSVTLKAQSLYSSATSNAYGVSYKSLYTYEYYLSYDVSNDSFSASGAEYTTYLPTSRDALGIDNTTSFTPTGDYNPATKKYVDDLLAGLGESESGVTTIELDNTSSTPLINSHEYFSKGVYKLTVKDNENNQDINIKLGPSTNYTAWVRCPALMIISHDSNSSLFPFVIFSGHTNDEGMYVTHGRMATSDSEMDISFNIKEPKVFRLDDNISNYDWKSDGLNIDYYLKDTKFALATDNTKEYTPTGDYNPATKKYVDSKANIIKQYEFRFTNTEINGYREYLRLDDSENAQLSTILTDAYQSGVSTLILKLVFTASDSRMATYLFHENIQDKPTALSCYGEYNSILRRFVILGSWEGDSFTSSDSYVNSYGSNLNIIYSKNKLVTESSTVHKYNTTEYTPTSDYHPATKKYVDDAVGAIEIPETGLNFEIVETLPTEDISTGTIYLVLNTEVEGDNVYDEYVYISSLSKFEHLGKTTIDLSNVYTKAEVETMIEEARAGLLEIEEIPTADYNTVENVIINSDKLFRVTDSYPRFYYNSTEYYPLQKGDIIFGSAQPVVYSSGNIYWKEGGYHYKLDLRKYTNVDTVLTKTNTTEYTPTENYHPATKKYVDDALNNVDVSDAVNAAIGDIETLPIIKYEAGYEDKIVALINKFKQEKYPDAANINGTEFSFILSGYTDGGSGLSSCIVGLNYGYTSSDRIYLAGGSVYREDNGYIGNANTGMTVSFLSIVIIGAWTDGVFTKTSMSIKKQYDLYFGRYNNVEWTPDRDYGIVHKKYVDDKVANIDTYTKAEVDALLDELRAQLQVATSEDIQEVINGTTEEEEVTNE